MPSSITDATEAESAVPAATTAEVDAFMDAQMKKDAAAEQPNAAAVAETPDETMKAAETAPTQKTVPAKLAPFMKAASSPAAKTPEDKTESKNQYIAVRVGYATINHKSPKPNKAPTAVTTMRNAIFLSWEDAKAFVEFEKQQEDLAKGEEDTVKTVPFYSNVEWKAFDQFEKAEAYLKKVMKSPATPAPEQPTKPKAAMPKTVKKKKKTVIVKHKIITVKANLPSRNRNRPTKKWMHMHDLAKAYKEAHGNLKISSTDTENAALFKWIKYQRDSYRLYLEDPIGGPHSMTDDKVNMLSEVGFEWIEGDKQKIKKTSEYVTIKTGRRGRPRMIRREQVVAPDEENDDDQSRAIRQKWMDMYEKLKAYVEQHGTTDIPKDTEDEELTTLRTWCAAQKSRYSMMQKGHLGKGMSSKKIDLLKSIGFNFPPNWNVMFAKLVSFKNDHGHLRVTPTDDAALAKWVATQNDTLGRHLQGKGTRLSEEEAMKLMGLGMVGGKRSLIVNELDSQRDARWNEMYLKLRAYKAEHGHSNPPTSSCTELSNWVAAQRRMYNKLIQGKPGKRAVLDAAKMQRLTEIGFQFRPRGSYIPWDDHMEKLRKFREENGHCRVPVNDPVLGNFVKLARREYKIKQQGNKSSMTLDRERELRELGFVFEGGKTPQRREGANKSWEERFEELLAFKEEHGHTVVPQNSGRLGQWVHSQRVNYKKLKEGKPTAMTAEKALKLTEIGFCFNASDRFRGNKQEERPQAEYNNMYAEVPPLPPTEYAWRGRYTE